MKSENKLMKVSIRTVKHIIPWMVLLAVFVLMVGMFAMYGSHNLNADDSSEMVLAAQLNKEGKFLSENWLYSTELRVISPVPLYQAGLMMFPDNWHAARTFAQAIIMLGVAASALYFASVLGFGCHAPLLAAILLMPFSFEYLYIVNLGGYYAVHLMLSLVILGLVLRSEKNTEHVKTGLVILALLGFLSGVGGLRMLTMLIVPLCIAAVVMALLALRKHDNIRGAVGDPSIRMAGRALVNTIAACLGYIVNAKVLSTRFSYQTFDDLLMSRVNVSEFSNQINGIIRTFGYRDHSPMLSIRGIGCWVALLVTFLVFTALVRMFIRRREIPAPHALLALVATTAIALGMMFNVFLGQVLVRYFIVGTLLLIAVLFVAIKTEPCRNEALRTVALWFVVGCFVFLSGCTMLYDWKLGKVNYEMAADWLVENGYTQGYATFWNANTLTEASDGKIEMWVLADSKQTEQAENLNEMDMQRTLQHMAHLEVDPEGRVFLLVDELENKMDSPLLSEEHFVDMIAWSYYVYQYDNVEEMRALIGTR